MRKINLKWWQKLLIYIPTSLVLYTLLCVGFGAMFKVLVNVSLGSAIFKPTVLILSFIIVYGGSVVFIILRKAKLNPHAEQSGTRYGERRFQTQSELKKKYSTFKSLEELKLKDKTSGILVRAEEKKDNKLSITQISGTHCLVNGTTRSGKTQCYVSPQIQVWANSAVKPSFLATDPKGELFSLNSKLLEDNGYQVLVLNLADPFESKRYNPLAIIEKQYKEFIKIDKKTTRTAKEEILRKELKNSFSAQLTDMCLQLMPPSPNSKDAYWTDKGRNLLKGLILARLEDLVISTNPETQKAVLLSQIYSIISQPIDKLQEYVNSREDISDARIALSEAVNNTGNSRGDIFSTATQILENLNEEGIKYICSKNEFDFEDILKKPTAIFIIIPDDNKARNIIATIFITQLYKFLIATARKLPNNKYEKPFFFLLEEFGTTETIPDIADWLNIAGGRNIWFILVLQEINQLFVKYGREKSQSIIAGCSLMNYILAKNPETLSLFSDIFGKTTKLQTNTSIDKDGNNSFSKSEVNELLITPSELQKVEFEQCVFVNGRDNPCRSNYVAIFHDKPFWHKGCIDKKELEFEILPQDYFIYRIDSIIPYYKNGAPTNKSTPTAKKGAIPKSIDNDNANKSLEEADNFIKDCVIESLKNLSKFFNSKQVDLLITLVNDNNINAFWDCLYRFKEQIDKNTLTTEFFDIYNDIEYTYQF